MEIFTLLGMIWVFLIAIELLELRSKRRTEEQNLREHLDQTIRVIKIEKISEQSNVILAYDAETDQFLGQGSTEDEVRQSIMNRFPEKIFLLNERPFTAKKIKGINA